MSTKWKVFLGALGFLFFCLVVWVVRTTPDAPPVVEKLDTPRTMSYEGNVLSEERDGVKIWDLSADSMQVNTANQNVEMVNPVAHFYPKDGNVVELRAKHGVYDQMTKNVHVDSEVIVTTKDGAKLTADVLDWVAGEETLIAEGKVKVTKEDLLAEGDRIEARKGFQHFKIQGNAHIVKGTAKK